MYLFLSVRSSYLKSTNVVILICNCLSSGEHFSFGEQDFLFQLFSFCFVFILFYFRRFIWILSLELNSFKVIAIIVWFTPTNTLHTLETNPAISSCSSVLPPYVNILCAHYTSLYSCVHINRLLVFIFFIIVTFSSTCNFLSIAVCTVWHPPFGFFLCSLSPLCLFYSLK